MKKLGVFWLLLVVGACSGSPAGCSNLIAHPTDDVWDAFTLSVFGLSIPGVAAPSKTKTTDDGAGSQGVYAACFSNVSDNHVFDLRIAPHNIALSTQVVLHITWYQDNGGSGNIRWCQEFNAGDVGYNFKTNNSLTDCTTTAAPGAEGVGTITKFSAQSFTISSRNTATQFHFWRNTGHGDDTYGDAACITGMQVYYKAVGTGLGALP